MGNISKALISNTEADTNIVKFGRDRSGNNPSTLEITQNGEYDVRYYAKVDVNVDANPNYKEVLTGKANKIELPEGFLTELNAGDANAEIVIDTSPLQMGINRIDGPIFNAGDELVLSYFNAAGGSVATAVGFEVRWDEINGECTRSNGMMAGNLIDISAYMSLLDYTLTIYHHRMPEDEEP